MRPPNNFFDQPLTGKFRTQSTELYIMLLCTFMYWTTVRFLPFCTISIGLYTTLADTIISFLASYTTFSTSRNFCKIHMAVLLIFSITPVCLFPDVFKKQIWVLPAIKQFSNTLYLGHKRSLCPFYTISRGCFLSGGGYCALILCRSCGSKTIFPASTFSKTCSLLPLRGIAATPSCCITKARSSCITVMLYREAVSRST